MVKAWIADVTPLLDKECYDSYYRQVPDFRKKKADALRLDKMRAQSVGVWALWQKIRAAYSLPEEAVFNFSHSFYTYLSYSFPFILFHANQSFIYSNHSASIRLYDTYYCSVIFDITFT